MFGITLNNRKPIHEQLTERITELVLSGVLEAEAPLPSVREMAAELGVNPNTVQRAYSELERAGVTYSVSGKGRFVTHDTAAVKDARKKEEMKRLGESVRELERLGCERDEILREGEKIFAREDVQND